MGHKREKGQTRWKFLHIKGHHQPKGKLLNRRRDLHAAHQGRASCSEQARNTAQPPHQKQTHSPGTGRCLMQWLRYPGLLADYPCASPGSTRESGFLLMHTLRDCHKGPSSRAPATQTVFPAPRHLGRKPVHGSSGIQIQK